MSGPVGLLECVVSQSFASCSEPVSIAVSIWATGRAGTDRLVLGTEGLLCSPVDVVCYLGEPGYICFPRSLLAFQKSPKDFPSGIAQAATGPGLTFHHSCGVNPSLVFYSKGSYLVVLSGG
jgi:hypothetical protein